LVGRIARLALLRVARLGEGQESRALAGRKLEAPPDAGHEQVEGETVRGIALTIKKVRAGSACGFRLAGYRYDGRCFRADVRVTFTGHSKQRSFGSQV
jgi:hypothetical protein